MGETASSWRKPLHSSGTDAPDQTRRESKGGGGALRFKRDDDGQMPGTAGGDPIEGICGPGVNASSVLTNPFHKG